jgi:monoamine oxidase
MIELNGNWHKIENQKEVFKEINNFPINFDVFVRRGNNVLIFVQNENTDQIYIVIQIYNTTIEIIHDTKEKAIEKLYSMLDQNNIDYLPLDKQKILDKLTDIDYYIANLVDSRSMYNDYHANMITDEMKKLISQIRREIKQEEKNNVQD